jgi:hypothetical protein
MSDMPCRITQEHVYNDPQDAPDHTPDDDTIDSLRDDVEWHKERYKKLLKLLKQQDEFIKQLLESSSD